MRSLEFSDAPENSPHRTSRWWYEIYVYSATTWRRLFFQPYTNDSQQQRPNEILIRHEEYNGDNFGIKDGSW